MLMTLVCAFTPRSVVKWQISQLNVEETTDGNSTESGVEHIGVEVNGSVTRGAQLDIGQIELEKVLAVWQLAGKCKDTGYIYNL